MDATLLHVISRLLDKTKLKEADLLELVRLLDMANIVTAYFENGREEVLFNLLALVQSDLPPTCPTCGGEPPLKKQRRYGKSPDVDPSPPLPSASLLIPGIVVIKTYTRDGAPDMTDLSNETEPFIVKEGISDWPAVSTTGNRWSNPAYLLKVAGRGRIVPVEIGSSYTAEGWTQRIMAFGEFLDKVNWDNKPSHDKINHEESDGQTEEPILYLAQHDLFQQFPDLTADILVPDYVFADPGPPEYFKDYHPPDVPSGYTKNAWMGPKNTYSPAHTDPYYNCYGKRSVLESAFVVFFQLKYTFIATFDLPSFID